MTKFWNWLFYREEAFILEVDRSEKDLRYRVMARCDKSNLKLLVSGAWDTREEAELVVNILHNRKLLKEVS